MRRSNGASPRLPYFYLYYFYEEGFRNFNMGYASGLALVLVVIIILITVFLNYTSKRWVYYESD